MKLVKLGSSYWNVENIISVRAVNNAVTELHVASGRYNVPFSLETVLELFQSAKKTVKVSQE